MKMLKLLGLMVFVVCIAAFASGCGGGGGGSTMDTETPTVPTEPSEPTVPAEPETPEQTIAGIRARVLGILTGASGLANTAGESATAIGGSEDVTDAQLSLAVTWHQNARTALSRIVAANTLATSATTLEEAQQALSAAQEALISLQTAQTQLASIQADLTPVVATPPATPPTTPTEGATAGTFTNNSSLIEELIDNKRVVDAAIDALVSDSLVVDPAGAIATNGTSCTAPCALYPADTGTGSTRNPGVRSVQIEITGATGTPFGSNTRDTLKGPSKFQYGFDIKNADNTIFVNAYTDITKTTLGDNPATSLYGDGAEGNGEKETDYVLNDTDYLLAGIWLTSSGITAFAYGSEHITGSKNFCTVSQNSGRKTLTATTASACAETSGFGTISSFVDPGDARTATYRGDANGAYLTGGDTSYFQASVELTAEFQNPASGAATGSIEGKVTNINAGGQSIPGSIELQKVDLTDTAIADEFTAETAGTVAGVPYVGNWKGQFFGLKAKQPKTATATATVNSISVTTTTTTYTPDAPGSVAGTFYATKQTESGGKAAFIGAFGANR